MNVPPGHRPRRLRIGYVWPVAGGVVGLLAAGLILVIGAATRSARVSLEPDVPALIRLPAPTVTATPSPTATPAATETPATQAEGGPFLVGDLVEVYGTSGDGVRLRASPSLDASINSLGQDQEVYQVLEGPVEASGFVWWRIVRLDDATRQGWAVETFLRELP